MNCVPMTVAELRELLSLAPDLRRLKVQRYKTKFLGVISILLGLDPYGTTPCLVPKLETIVCEIYCGHWDPLAFTKMVRSRLAKTSPVAASPLKKVVLNLTRLFTDNQDQFLIQDEDRLLIRNSVREFREMGLDISIMLRDSDDDPFTPIDE